MVTMTSAARTISSAQGWGSSRLAGVALTLDESLLLVSALDVTFGTSQVLVINLATQEQGIVNKSIGVNHASGGLHRAHNRNFMAWCGVTAGGGGGLVYRVEFK